MKYVKYLFLIDLSKQNFNNYAIFLQTVTNYRPIGCKILPKNVPIIQNESLRYPHWSIKRIKIRTVVLD